MPATIRDITLVSGSRYRQPQPGANDAHCGRPSARKKASAAAASRKVSTLKPTLSRAIRRRDRSAISVIIKAESYVVAGSSTMSLSTASVLLDSSVVLVGACRERCSGDHDAV